MLGACVFIGFSDYVKHIWTFLARYVRRQVGR